MGPQLRFVTGDDLLCAPWHSEAHRFEIYLLNTQLDCFFVFFFFIKPNFNLKM